MRSWLIGLLLILAISGSVSAQNGRLGIYADPGAGECRIVDTAGIVHAFVVHDVGAAGATGSSFRVAPVGGVTLTFFADSPRSPFLISGSSAAGCRLDYISCQGTGLVMVLDVVYFGTATSTDCSELRLVAHPGGPAYVEARDCQQPVANSVEVSDSRAYIGGDALSCACPADATLRTTWGSIKSLYR